MHYWIIAVIALIGAVGGFMNGFIGDAGFHRPKMEHGVWHPGFIRTMLIGAVAAIGSWASLKTLVLIGAGVQPLAFSTGAMANALLVGFGGARWFKSETEKDIFRKTAAIAAKKNANVDAATTIATATPLEALCTAINMQ
jgi:hypothetical protein